MLKTVERAVETLPAMRQALASAHPLCVLHGDAHAGNVVVCPGDPPRIVLLDWGRARMGSPLEDVSSWLQSLGFWEWEVRRRHDSLLRSYLLARGWDDRLTPELRSLYWFAAASNALAGALRYHLAVANDPDRGEWDRYQSAKAAQDWLRMIRRADVAWRN
jgi:aminoglycoside phosphotransferase (APT) family kinase protein